MTLYEQCLSVCWCDCLLGEPHHVPMGLYICHTVWKPYSRQDEHEFEATAQSRIAQSCMNISWKSYIIVPVGGTRRENQTPARQRWATAGQRGRKHADALQSASAQPSASKPQAASQIIRLHLSRPIEGFAERCIAHLLNTTAEVLKVLWTPGCAQAV